MCKCMQYAIMCIRTLGLVRDVRSYAICHNMYQSIGGSSGICDRTQYVIMCIRTVGVRPGSAIVRLCHNVYQNIGAGQEVIGDDEAHT